MQNILIAITDDDDLIVKLLDNYLSSNPKFKVLFTANSGELLLEKLKRSAFLPDILILDLKMSGINGIEITQNLRENYPFIKIVIITSHYQQSFMGFMLKTGASAFLPKGISPEVLVTVLDEVYEKGVYFLNDQIDTIRGQMKDKLPEPKFTNEADLTTREIEILKLIAEQKTAKEISEILSITTRTVEGHKSNLFLKTEAKNIAGLVIYAIQNKIINIEEYPRF